MQIRKSAEDYLEAILVLSKQGQSQIWHFLIEETERRGIGMIVVSHSPELVEKVCTRVVRMEI